MAAYKEFPWPVRLGIDAAGEVHNPAPAASGILALTLRAPLRTGAEDIVRTLALGPIGAADAARLAAVRVRVETGAGVAVRVDYAALLARIAAASGMAADDLGAMDARDAHDALGLLDGESTPAGQRRPAGADAAAVPLSRMIVRLGSARAIVVRPATLSDLLALGPLTEAHVVGATFGLRVRRDRIAPWLDRLTDLDPAALGALPAADGRRVVARLLALAADPLHLMPELFAP